jgi:hypothetical protein
MRHLKYFAVGLFWLALTLSITAVAAIIFITLFVGVVKLAFSYTTIFFTFIISFVIGKIAYELGKGMSNREGLPEELDEPVDDSDE